jgi:predicted permease
VGAAGIRLLARFGTDRLPLGTQVAFDDRVALASLLGSILVGLGIALPIAWYNLRAQATGALHAQSRATTAGRAAQRLRHAFLVAQVTLAFVLLAGAGLLGVSLQKVMAQPSGFQPELVLSGRVSLPWKQYADGAARLAFAERVTEALGREPGVRAAGIATNVPLSGNSGRSAATVKGRVRQPGEAPHGIYSYGVGGAYFEALGHSLRVGRFLAADDARRDGRVCVVDEDFARRNFPDRPAIGQRLFIGGAEGPDAEAFTIVGIVGPVKQAALTDDVAQGAVFYPYPYLGDTELFVVLRSSLPEESLSSTLQRVVRAIDAEVPVTDIRSMEGRIEDSLLARRSPALLAAIFAGIALLLTAMGTYGVLSHAVTLRRREIGLRIALGASAADVRGQFVSIGVRLLAAGTMLGVAGAWITGRAMQAVLFDVPPLHVATLAGTAATIVVVSLAACLLPSERAARTSPTEVLAEE